MDCLRRTFLTVLGSSAALALIPATGHAADVKRYSLVTKRRDGQLLRYSAVTEVEGQLRLNADGKKVITQPIKVLSNLEFDEKTLAAKSNKPQQVARYYDKAEAAIKIDKSGLTNKLREDARTICLQLGDENATYYSPLGPLTRDELELVKLSGDPIVWHALLPAEAVAIGDTWKLSDGSLAILLGVEVITESDVTAKLVKVDDELAAMELAGTANGAIGGIATELDVRAKYNFDRALEQITWLALGVKEKRAIGHAEPGFETTARTRVSAEPLSTSPQLADDLLKQFPLELKEGSTLLIHDSTEGGFQLIHDRRWHVMTDDRDTSILRLVDRGDLIAQCNISRLKNLPKDKQLALDAFQEEVIKTVGSNFQQLVDSSQGKTDGGLRQLRVVCAGNVQDVPVQWNYYHLTDEQGRNISLVFTFDSQLAERFAELDRGMIGSIQMRTRKDEVATPAAEQQAEKPTPSKRKL